MRKIFTDAAPVPGDLPQIARVTGSSLSLVRKVSVGQRRNEQVVWALARVKELREAMWNQLQQEYQEKFGSNNQSI